MISFTGQRSAYFTVSSKDIKSLDPGVGGFLQTLNKDVTGITINEEQGKLITGSITLNDPDITYFDVMKRGALVDLEWGYKDPLQSAQQIVSKKANPTEIVGPILRTGLKVLLTSPKVSAKNTNEVTTVMNFRSGFSMIRERKTITYRGTRGTVVRQALIASGVPAPFILFGSQNEPTGRNGIRQRSETYFQFLRRAANRWGLLFRVGHTASGDVSAIFVDYSVVSQIPFSELMTGGVGNDQLFEYRGGISNVLEYNAEYVFAQDGGGDNVRLSIIDNKVIENRSLAKTERVQGFRLNTAKLKAAMIRERNRGGIAAAQKLLTDILDATDFQDERIKRFWEPHEYKTALQRGGFKVTMKTFGNPLFTPPNDAKFGNGFPTEIVKKGNFRMRKTSHQISKEGYYCSHEVRDYYGFRG